LPYYHCFSTPASLLQAGIYLQTLLRIPLKARIKSGGSSEIKFLLITFFFYSTGKLRQLLVYYKTGLLRAPAPIASPVRFARVQRKSFCAEAGHKRLERTAGRVPEKELYTTDDADTQITFR